MHPKNKSALNLTSLSVGHANILQTLQAFNTPQMQQDKYNSFIYHHLTVFVCGQFKKRRRFTPKMCTCIFCTVIYISLLILFLTIYVFGSSLSLNTHISERDCKAAPLLVYYIKEYFSSFLESIYLSLLHLYSATSLQHYLLLLLNLLSKQKGMFPFFQPALC